jgi:sigma-B regulation protein RsbU (phosphoserine phosphatase)
MLQDVERILTPLTILLIGVFLYGYERPIRRSLKEMARNGDPSPALLDLARRRLLNEPVLVALIDLGGWVVSALGYALFLGFTGEPWPMILHGVMVNLITGLVTAVVVFFVLDHAVNAHLGPHFFPEGGSSKVPGVFRLTITMRLMGLFLAANVIPLWSFLQIYIESGRLGLSPAEELVLLKRGVLFLSLAALSMGLVLAFFVGHHFSVSLGAVVRVLQRIREGDFDTRALVTSNDEIGYTADVINEMTDGLKERDALKESMRAAREIQQGLLPRTPPVTPGLDVFGQSLYRDPTGGDYFDYLHLGTEGDRRLGLVIGDVSGHGLPAALLMVSARATLRHGLFDSDDLAQVFRGLGRQVYDDAKETGQFMTLFYLEIDRTGPAVRWVNAGHAPALVYNPDRDDFSRLEGRGPALGVVRDFPFPPQAGVLAAGSILVLATDGVWEAPNAQGEAYGLENLRQAIRVHRNRSAREIVAAVFEELDAYRGTGQHRDDLTLVVTKVL